MKITNGLDYRDIERGLRTVADKFIEAKGHDNSPFNRLKSKNFMTSNVVTIRKLSNGVWFELSYGTGFSNDYIFGVTFMDNKGTDFEDICACCYEFSEVEAVLEKAMELTVGA